MVANFATGAHYRFLLRGEWANTNSAANSVGDIRPYWFRSVKEFPNKRIDFLSPPHGHNLFSILQSNKRLKLLVSEFVQDRGFKLTFRQATSELEISKEENNILTTYPYSLVSDTIQRIIFYTSAIESNPKNSTLVFEEPESSVFPYYTKYLAEKIALDTERQYFITTHNPYFLQAVIEKVPANELAINLVTMEQYQTEVKPLSERAYEEILTLSSDVFLNFDKLLEV